MKCLITLFVLSFMGLMLSSCSDATTQRYSAGPTAYEIEQENRYRFDKREADRAWR